MEVCKVKSTYLHQINDRFEWRVYFDHVKRDHAYAEVKLINKRNGRQWLGMIPTTGLQDLRGSTFTVLANSDGSPRSNTKWGKYFVETTNMKRGDTIPVDLTPADILDLMTILDEVAASTEMLYRYKIAKQLREHLYSARFKGLVNHRTVNLEINELVGPTSPEQVALTVSDG